MNIRVVDYKAVYDYVSFCKNIYKNNIYYRDILTPTLKSILKGKGEICKSTIIKPIMVMDSGEIVAVCTFAIVDRMNDVLQIAYFEALENQEKAVEAIIDYGRDFARQQGITKILVGLNFHVNYGLGLLADHFREIQSFGSAYNPPYYIDYFKSYASEEIPLVSYLTKMDDFDFGVSERLIKRITSKYKVRRACFKNIEREAEIYTYLNNNAFKNHRFYYERRLNEDLELFKEFKVLLREENLLFMEHEGKPIGFMLWYPDFNQLIKPDKVLGIKTAIKNRLFHSRINKFKIVEIGVLPQFQKSGAILALFKECWEIVKGRYEYCEAGWVLEENFDSKALGIRWAEKEYKHYKAFIIDV